MENKLPLLGDKFPEFWAQTTDGNLQLPEFFKGKWFVLFSHPGDFTPVCTTEFVSFQKNYDKFRELNCELIGLSIDQVFSHIKWEEWIKEKLGVNIEFPIIADNGDIAMRLGMIHPGKGNNTVRAVFIVDDNGRLRSMLYYPQEIGRNISEIIRMVKALQVTGKHGVATPANWPENEILGDKVIVPPATSKAKAKENASKYQCYDWWFCFREL